MQISTPLLVLLATMISVVLVDLTSACCHGSSCNIFACNCDYCMPRYGSAMTYPDCGYFSSTSSSCYTNYNGVYYTAGRKKRQANDTETPATVENATTVATEEESANATTEEVAATEGHQEVPENSVPKKDIEAAKTAAAEEKAKEKSKFQELDTNGDKVISREEAAAFAVEAAGASKAQLARSSEWFKELDLDEDGKIELGEFDQALE